MDLKYQVKLVRHLFRQANDSLSHLGCCFYFVRFCRCSLLVSFSNSPIESIHLSFFFLTIFFFFFLVVVVVKHTYPKNLSSNHFPPPSFIQK